VVLSPLVGSCNRREQAILQRMTTHTFTLAAPKETFPAMSDRMPGVAQQISCPSGQSAPQSPCPWRGMTSTASGDAKTPIFRDPERLKPGKTRHRSTEEAAEQFASLTYELRTRGHDPQTVAHVSKGLCKKPPSLPRPLSTSVYSDDAVVSDWVTTRLMVSNRRLTPAAPHSRPAPRRPRLGLRRWRGGGTGSRRRRTGSVSLPANCL
jgi:hypothetical protein